ncbi:hypothetical protein BJV74DRAFT_867410 [Russula compacta]|nr:hypothetical protein BJV74DRAFT_867410 [Russula compacta]
MYRYFDAVSLCSTAFTRFQAADAPPLTKLSYVPPRGAANSSACRVGGSWRMPMAAVLLLASPIPSCAASPYQVAA